MNIDTLNAYCGNELVSFSYLAQGRLNICQGLFVQSLDWALVFRLTVAAVPQSTLCRVCYNSTLGPLQSGLACLLAAHAWWIAIALPPLQPYLRPEIR